MCVGYQGSRQPVHLLCASDDGKWLATANTDCEIHIYNLHKMKVSSDLLMCQTWIIFDRLEFVKL